MPAIPPNRFNARTALRKNGHRVVIQRDHETDHGWLVCAPADWRASKMATRKASTYQEAISMRLSARVGLAVYMVTHDAERATKAASIAQNQPNTPALEHVRAALGETNGN